MAIKAIIFDLGGVVFDFSFDNAFEAWAVLTEISAEELKKEFKFSESFEKFERSDISPQQFMDDISKQLNYNIDGHAFEEGWNSIYMDEIEGIGGLLSSLKKNYRLVALTNTNLTHEKIWRTRYSIILRNFEKIFCSHEIRARKPERKAFQAVLDYLNLDAREIIFLDDNKECANGAKQLGIHAVWVTSYNQMLRELKQFGIQQE